MMEKNEAETSIETQAKAAEVQALKEEEGTFYTHLADIERVLKGAHDVKKVVRSSLEGTSKPSKPDEDKTAFHKQIDGLIDLLMSSATQIESLRPNAKDPDTIIAEMLSTVSDMMSGRKKAAEIDLNALVGMLVRFKRMNQVLSQTNWDRVETSSDLHYKKKTPQP